MYSPRGGRSAVSARLDEFTLVEPGRVVSQRLVEHDDPIFKGHYPEQPVYPGVLMMEMAELAVRHYFGAEGGRLVVNEIESFRLLAPVRPAGLLVAECTIEPHAVEGSHKVKAEFMFGEVVASRASFRVSMP